MVNTQDINAQAVNAVGALRQESCLGRTCMKWREDGELTDLDFQLILQRLIKVDEQAGGLLH